MQDTHEITWYVRGSWQQAKDLMHGDVVQVGAFDAPPTERNTSIVKDTCTMEGEGTLVEWADGQVTYGDSDRKVWVVGDTTPRGVEELDLHNADVEDDTWEASENMFRIVVDVHGKPLGMVGPGPTYAIVPIDDRVRATDGALYGPSEAGGGDEPEPLTYEDPIVCGDDDEIEDFGVEPKAPRYVACEEPSERVQRLSRGALGGPSKLYPNLHGFGWDVTSTPKDDGTYPNAMRKCRQAIEAAQRFIECAETSAPGSRAARQVTR